jgi:hypothetical protein
MMVQADKGTSSPVVGFVPGVGLDKPCRAAPASSFTFPCY